MLTGLLPNIIIISFFIIFFGIKFLKRSISRLHYFYWIIFGVYIANLIALTLFPFPYQERLIQIMIEDDLGLPHNFIPFNGIKEAIEYGYAPIALTQIGGNILLFVPLGFALPIMFRNIKNVSVVIIGFLGSLIIETTQLILGIILGYNYRSFDVDDLLMNTLGAIIGLLVFKLLFTLLKKNNLLLKH